MHQHDIKITPRVLILVAIGVATYTFGFVNFNMANHLAEGGVAGITLIIHALTGISPAYTSLFINIPLFILGARVFGKKALLLTIYGTVLMSIFIDIWMRIPVTLDLNGDFLIAALLSGIFAGLGSGLVFRYGATTGGTDIVGRLIEEKTGRQLGQTLLIIDAIVLLASLTYIDVRHMMYTLIASFVYSQVLTMVQNGGYTVRGMIIVTKESEKVASHILRDINRGVTYLKGEGAYSGHQHNVLYVVLNPNEVMEVKRIVADIDKDAFVSIINVDEVVSSDFIIRRKKYDKA
ncbi:YitT family protein [Streptococcus plurextorum]|uniref:YitT family protein n=1 Tax=Streptococcus plurextorum TaxID=456876 RepID=UPI00040B7782|nr:YitT family protein [Streptococcus plurextorum]